MAIYVIGYPSGYGGADTELWHILKLWCGNGLEVKLIPTWEPGPGWEERCRALGATTCLIEGPQQFCEVEGLAGSIVVSFCNDQFLRNAHYLRELDCRLVWAGCMNWLFEDEIAHYRAYAPFGRYVFQSWYQRQVLLPQLAEYGVRESQCHVIHGAFDAAEFLFEPRIHRQSEEYVIGRLSRADPSKWNPDTWQIYDSIPYRPLKARVMAWEGQLARTLGQPPAWVERPSACEHSAHEFLQSLHCLVQLSGSAVENWSRVGLEAMATGVPIVTDRRGGWLEMIEHGRTGFLVNSPAEAVKYVDSLARDELLRFEIIKNARQRLEERFRSDEALMQLWLELFAGLGYSKDFEASKEGQTLKSF